MAKQTWKAGNMLYPLPAVMVSMADGEGKSNIITVAWAGTVCTNPPMLSISVRPERYSYDILKRTGEFVVNLTTEKLAYATDYCGVRSGRDVDKFKEMNFMGHLGEQVYIGYYGRHCNGVAVWKLPEDKKYQIEIIDMWEMTRKVTMTEVCGKVTIKMPGKEGIAILAKQM